mgnify:CR=1 FL=1
MRKNYVKEYKGYKVPEGASCFVEACEAYRNHFGKTVAGVDYVFVVDNEDPEWVSLSDMLPLSIRGAVELPEEPTQEWVDGLPPLNSEVLLSDEEGYLFSSASNEKVSIAEDEVLVVVSIGARYDNGNPVVTLMTKDSKNLQGFVTVNPEFLEPVKTQEQKDREAFVDAGIISYMESESNAVKDRDLELLLERMFSDGFKAPEGE